MSSSGSLPSRRIAPHGADSPPSPLVRPNPREAVSPGWRLALGIVRRLPQAGISRLVGWFAERTVPRALRKGLIGGFARLVGADVDEAARGVDEHASIAAFFTRELRPGARSWPAEPDVYASPVDGIVGAVGEIREGSLIQAKGLAYTTADILASEADARRFQEGLFVTLYLSPRHYHRIHAPASGRLRAARAVPGALLPVNVPAVSSIPRLFPRNERLVAHLRTGEGTGEGGGDGEGEIAVIAVGAFNVGRISAAFEPAWNGPRGRGVTNRRARRRLEERSYEPGVEVARGEEIMAFHLGSTVVLLFDPEAVRGRHPNAALIPGAEIRLGDPLLVAEE